MTDVFPERSGSEPIRDLYMALSEPTGYKGLSLAGQWALLSLRNFVIVPKFGSLGHFMVEILRIREECKGYGGLMSDQITASMVRKLFPADQGVRSC